MRIELTTERFLAAGGAAVARAPDGRVVFVEGAAPNERVEIEIEEEHPRFLRGRAARVLEPSSDRVAPRCRHFGECGGCALQHVSAAAQTASKENAAIEALRRIGKIDVDRVAIDPAWSGAPYGYRTRARFALSRTAALGFKRRASNEVIDLAECPILDPALESARAEISRALRETTAPEGRMSRRGRERLEGEREVLAVTEGGAVAVDLPGGVSAPASLGAVAELGARDGHGPLVLSPRVFAQSNAAGNAAMLDHVAALLAADRERFGPPRSAVELYAGSGNFTRELVRAGLEEVVAIEGDRRAAELLSRVAPKLVRVLVGDVDRTLRAELDRGVRAEVLLADPPRAGLSRSLPGSIAELEPRCVIFVSCDPAAFARDAARLHEHGFTLSRFRVFDLYPQTPHAEVIGQYHMI